VLTTKAGSGIVITSKTQRREE